MTDHYPPMKTLENTIDAAAGSGSVHRLVGAFLPRPYHEEPAVTIYHGDCRQIMPMLSGFDLLMADPPYGIAESSKKVASRQRKAGGKSASLADQRDYGDFDWDNEPVEDWVMFLARRMCVKQIIFGGNYYDLPPAKCWLLWDKENGENDFADAEMAWTNLEKAVRVKRHMWNGMLRKGGEERHHPTQKPLEVIQWAILQAGDAATILDPWAGSGTTGHAAKSLGKKAVLIEREERYCEIAARRLAQEVLPIYCPNNQITTPGKE
jgi:DNA modification methylase